MRVQVQLFAFLRESLGDTVEIEVDEPVTASRLMTRFLETYPQFRGSEGSLNLAVDQNYVIDDCEISADQEVAIFPPVSGGRAR